ncbi:FixH family protein [Cellulophaga sp. Hel_I_12]|uniref:FixH family protein n=1 Tax=Cellulophaga sp. Hel_I_12 TaxID=1249972 RepID=UPI0006465D45|nr:FixH family protein [Cellulophaga sp. Hel_I_12]
MKINWGTGIVLALAAFISFILFFVIRMSMDDKSNHDLVTEEYYKQELTFQKDLDAQNNAINTNNNLIVAKTPEGLLVTFPENLEFEKVKGTVSLYRPSNKQLDFDFPISLSNTNLLVPDKRLLDGRWDIKVSWNYKDEEFLSKKSITY